MKYRSKYRKNTLAWDVVNPYTDTEVRISIVMLTRSSSVTSNSERREEASPASYEPSTDAYAQQAQNEQPAVSPQPDTNTQLVTSQEQAVDVQPGTATKRGPGRPLLEESAKLQEERSIAHEFASCKLHFHLIMYFLSQPRTAVFSS